MTKKKDENLTKEEALSLAWKNRKNYKGYDRSKGSIFNSWRSITNTSKGKIIGFPDSWKDYDSFFNDCCDGWERGRILRRFNTKEPYSKDNCFWAEKGTENIKKLVILEYENQNKTLLEWCKIYSLNYNGVRQRFFRLKNNITPHEILFGKTRKTKTKREMNIDFKINRKIGAYRLRDKNKGLTSDIDRDFFDQITVDGCFYCGDKENLGLDRIDNKIGHLKTNVVACCYICNTARNDHFTIDEMKILGSTIRQIKEQRKKRN